MKFLWLELQLKKGKSLCLAVICRKRSAFEMQFHLKVVSIFLKDHGDSSSRLLERKQGHPTRI